MGVVNVPQNWSKVAGSGVVQNSQSKVPNDWSQNFGTFFTKKKAA